MGEIVVEPASVARWRRRLSRRLSRGGLVLVGWAIASVPVVVDEAPQDGHFLVAGAVIGAVAIAASWVVWFAASVRPCRITVGEGRLRAAGWDVGASSITSSYEVERAGHHEVEVVLTDGDMLVLHVPGADERAAIVEGLGFGRGGRRVAVDLASLSGRSLHVLYGILAYAVASVLALALSSILPVARSPGAFVLPTTVILTAVLYAAVLRATRAPRLTVGADGVAFETGWRRGVAPFDAVGGVARPEIRTVGGVVGLASKRFDAARRATVFRLAAERRAEVARARAGAGFSRDGRGIAAWREHARRLLGDGSYRFGATTADQAAEVIVAAGATPDERVGAALALGDPARVGVALEAIVDPRLREALAAAAAGDDERLERALGKLA